MPDRSGEALVPGGGRSLAELKQEVMRRAERGMPPLSGIAAQDARDALASIASLERGEWARAFSAVAERHAERAQSAAQGGTARDAWWQAWRVFHFARWPTENVPERCAARDRALEAFRRYSALLAPPIEVVRIPYENRELVAYLRVPLAPRPAPLVFAIAGLDSRKEDFAAHSDVYLKRGIALFAVDLPGTGESPARAAEPRSDRIFSAALDYLATRPEVDARRIVVQGRSWSGYWAAKLAVSEAARLRGAIVHGGPVHHYFQPGWLAASLTTGEYLYDYLAAKCAMHGATSLEELLALARAFSLLESGILDRPATAVLAVNGARDSQIPIADLYLLLEHGTAKDAWVNPEGGHMGRSPEWTSPAIAEKILLPWIARRLS